MNRTCTALIFLVAATVFLAGCMTQNPPPAPTTVPATTALPGTPVPTIPSGECVQAADCIPAECCHPSSCIPGPRQKPCTLMCTMVCSGPLDCGAGSCGCVQGKCSVVPASPAPVNHSPLTITASPARYSPVMSSTPGIGLEPVVTGFSPGDATFTWNASYGRFLSWNSPDYRVNELGDSVVNHGEKLYWSFIDRPASTAVPVTITVTATENGSGRVLGSSVVTLAWDGDFAVVVKG